MESGVGLTRAPGRPTTR
ncbi:unnamed protein product [Oppiella nova]|uniref:Uncharacterized protein n=1 Tax=Oppiella nova TaxID=334625 RepID=A0A7R9MUK7_9ACAR|nr:unnamed protein product [Oppiella nova]CAG2183119.1 unnamed protein product [Oppiella nova]